MKRLLPLAGTALLLLVLLAPVVSAQALWGRYLVASLSHDDKDAINGGVPEGTTRFHAPARNGDGWDFSTESQQLRWHPLHQCNNQDWAWTGNGGHFGCLFVDERAGSCTSVHPPGGAHTIIQYVARQTFSLSVRFALWFSDGDCNGGNGLHLRNDFVTYPHWHGKPQYWTGWAHCYPGGNSAIQEVQMNVHDRARYWFDPWAGDPNHDSTWAQIYVYGSCHDVCNDQFCQQEYLRSCVYGEVSPYNYQGNCYANGARPPITPPPTVTFDPTGKYVVASLAHDNRAANPANGQTRAQARADGWAFSRYDGLQYTWSPLQCGGLPNLPAYHTGSGCGHVLDDTNTNELHVHTPSGHHATFVDYTFQEAHPAATVRIAAVSVSCGLTHQDDGVSLDAYIIRGGSIVQSVQARRNVGGCYAGSEHMDIVASVNALAGDTLRIRMHKNQYENYDNLRLQAFVYSDCGTPCTSEFCSYEYDRSCNNAEPVPQTFTVQKGVYAVRDWSDAFVNQTEFTPVAAAVSGQHGSLFGVNVFDGAVGTVWNPGASQGWIILDLGEVRQLRDISVYANGPHGHRSMYVYTCPDFACSSQTLIGQVYRSTYGSKLYTVWSGTAQAQFVKLDVPANGWAKGWVEIGEVLFNAFTTPTAIPVMAAIPTPVAPVDPAGRYLVASLKHDNALAVAGASATQSRADARADGWTMQTSGGDPLRWGALDCGNSSDVGFTDGACGSVVDRPSQVGVIVRAPQSADATLITYPSAVGHVTLRLRAKLVECDPQTSEQAAGLDSTLSADVVRNGVVVKTMVPLQRVAGCRANETFNDAGGDFDMLEGDEVRITLWRSGHGRSDAVELQAFLYASCSVICVADRCGAEYARSCTVGDSLPSGYLVQPPHAAPVPVPAFEVVAPPAAGSYLLASLRDDNAAAEAAVTIEQTRAAGRADGWSYHDTTTGAPLASHSTQCLTCHEAWTCVPSRGSCGAVIGDNTTCVLIEAPTDGGALAVEYAAPRDFQRPVTLSFRLTRASCSGGTAPTVWTTVTDAAGQPKAGGATQRELPACVSSTEESALTIARVARLVQGDRVRLFVSRAAVRAQMHVYVSCDNVCTSARCQDAYGSACASGEPITGASAPGACVDIVNGSAPVVPPPPPLSGHEAMRLTLVGGNSADSGPVADVMLNGLVVAVMQRPATNAPNVQSCWLQVFMSGMQEPVGLPFDLNPDGTRGHFRACAVHRSSIDGNTFIVVALLNVHISWGRFALRDDGLVETTSPWWSVYQRQVLSYAVQPLHAPMHVQARGGRLRVLLGDPLFIVSEWNNRQIFESVKVSDPWSYTYRCGWSTCSRRHGPRYRERTFYLNNNYLKPQDTTTGFLPAQYLEWTGEDGWVRPFPTSSTSWVSSLVAGVGIVDSSTSRWVGYSVYDRRATRQFVRTDYPGRHGFSPLARVSLDIFSGVVAWPCQPVDCNRSAPCDAAICVRADVLSSGPSPLLSAGMNAKLAQMRHSSHVTLSGFDIVDRQLTIVPVKGSLNGANYLSTNLEVATDTFFVVYTSASTGSMYRQRVRRVRFVEFELVGPAVEIASAVRLGSTLGHGRSVHVVKHTSEDVFVAYRGGEAYERTSTPAAGESDADMTFVFSGNPEAASDITACAVFLSPVSAFVCRLPNEQLSSANVTQNVPFILTETCRQRRGSASGNSYVWPNAPFSSYACDVDFSVDWGDVDLFTAHASFGLETTVATTTATWVSQRVRPQFVGDLPDITRVTLPPRGLIPPGSRVEFVTEANWTGYEVRNVTLSNDVGETIVLAEGDAAGTTISISVTAVTVSLVLSGFRDSHPTLYEAPPLEVRISVGITAGGGSRRQSGGGDGGAEIVVGDLTTEVPSTELPPEEDQDGGNSTAAEQCDCPNALDVDYTTSDIPDATRHAFSAIFLDDDLWLVTFIVGNVSKLRRGHVLAGSVDAQATAADAFPPLVEWFNESLLWNPPQCSLGDLDTPSEGTNVTVQYNETDCTMTYVVTFPLITTAGRSPHCDVRTDGGELVVNCSMTLTSTRAFDPSEPFAFQAQEAVFAGELRMGTLLNNEVEQLFQATLAKCSVLNGPVYAVDCRIPGVIALSPDVAIAQEPAGWIDVSSCERTIYGDATFVRCGLNSSAPVTDATTATATLTVALADNASETMSFDVEYQVARLTTTSATGSLANFVTGITVADGRYFYGTVDEAVVHVDVVDVARLQITGVELFNAQGAVRDVRAEPRMRLSETTEGSTRFVVRFLPAQLRDDAAFYRFGPHGVNLTFVFSAARRQQANGAEVAGTVTVDGLRVEGAEEPGSSAFAGRGDAASSGRGGASVALVAGAAVGAAVLATGLVAAAAIVVMRRKRGVRHAAAEGKTAVEL